MLPFLGNNSTSKSSLFSPSEKFYEYFPFYLSIGMTYEQFWDEDCLLVKYYRKAHRMKQERLNQELWLQGAYFYEALTDVAPILQAFAKKGTKVTPYLSEPFALTSKEVRERKYRDEKLKYDEQKARIAAWASKNNMRMLEKEVKENG